MQGKDTKISTFHQLFLPLLSEQFQEQLINLEVDKYVKKLTTTQLIELLAHAQIEQQPGLRDISNAFNNEEFSKVLGVDSFSASQISRRLRDLPTKAVELCFQDIQLQFAKEVGFHTVEQWLGRLRLIDSSTISLCLSRYPWADFRKTKAGIKLHLRLKFWGNDVIPDRTVITPAKPADKTQMDNLVVEEEDALNVIDRGYVDYAKFDRLL